MPVVIVDWFGLFASFCLTGSFFNTLLMDLHENVTKKRNGAWFFFKAITFWMQSGFEILARFYIARSNWTFPAIVSGIGKG